MSEDRSRQSLNSDLRTRHAQLHAPEGVEQMLGKGVGVGDWELRLVDAKVFAYGAGFEGAREEI